VWGGGGQLPPLPRQLEKDMNRIVKSIAKAYYRALGYYPTSIHGLKFKLDPYHIGFWRNLRRGLWEPHTYTIMSKFLNIDSIYCDVGAWIGPTVVYAAKICKQVICFEPDPIAYQYLRWNIELNELLNVTSFSIALANRIAIQRMSSFGGNLGDSMTSLLNDNQENNGIDALTLTWDAFIDLSKIDKIDFLKIDIEGGEFALVPTLKDYLSLHKPIVHLSTHAPYCDVNLRKEKMQQIIEVMGIYKKCLNKNLMLVGIDELNGEDAKNSFRSYIFMD
jgi:FkbM family methyltransferase